MKNPVHMRRLGRLLFCLIVALLAALNAEATGPATTTVADTVYRADGSTASGTLVIAWPAFTTADGKAVSAGRKTVKIGAAGAVSIPLVPNFGASPEGTYYKVSYKLDDGSTSEEYWSVPAAPTTTISAIRSKLVPANVAVQYATRQYVDSMLAGGGSGSGNAIKIQGKDVDAAQPVRGQSLTFDGTKYVPQSHAIVDVVRDCGAVGDGVSNDGPAIQACIDANKGRTILFPQTRPPGSCSYLISTAAGSSGNDKFGLIMNGHGQRLTGDTHGIGVGALGNGVTLCFAAGLTGVLVPNSNAIPGVPASNVGCQGCAVENLMLRGSEPYTASDPTTAILPGVGDTSANYGGSTGASQADGIRCAATGCTLRDVGVQNFGRHGIYLDGNAAAGAFADGSFVYNVHAQNNRGSGLFNRGGDSNASTVTNVQCSGNQLWCIENYSFLGSTFVGGMAHAQHVDNTAGHTSSFTISSLTNSGNVTTATFTANHNFKIGMAVVVSGTAHYNGTYFVSAVPATNQVQWAQTSPIATDSAGTATNATATQMWALAGSDAIGGCFRSSGGAVTSVFVNPYCESDNNGANLVNASSNIVLGGDIGNNFDWANHPPNWITTTTSGMSFTPVVYQGRTSAGTLQDAGLIVGGNVSSSLAAGDNQILNFFNGNAFAAPPFTKGHLEFRLTRSSDGTGVWGFRCCSTGDLSGLANYPFYMEYGATTGTGNTNPKAGFPNGFWFGGANVINESPLWFGNTNAISHLPTGFTQPAGSIAVNNQAAAGGFAGWIATTSGAPGTYRAFGPVAKDATGTNWSFPTLDLGAYQDVTETTTPANPVAGAQRWYANAATHRLSCLTSAGGDCSPGGGGAATPLATGTTVTLTAPRQYYVCTGACTVTPPVPVAGYEFCVLNDDNVSGVITLAALGSSARYENTARTAYGTAGTGTLVSSGAAGDKVCIVGRDSTHYLTVSYHGTWTAN